MQDPLAALRPLHTPLPISWWPPAPGWWLLALITIVLLILLYRHWQRLAPRRAALSELKILEQQNHKNQQLTAILNSLLKRYALACWPSSSVAALTGEAWLKFLDANGGGGEFAHGCGRCLASAPYQNKSSQTDGLVLLVRRWIKKNKPKKANLKRIHNV